MVILKAIREAYLRGHNVAVVRWNSKNVYQANLLLDRGEILGFHRRDKYALVIHLNMELAYLFVRPN